MLINNNNPTSFKGNVHIRKSAYRFLNTLSPEARHSTKDCLDVIKKSPNNFTTILFAEGNELFIKVQRGLGLFYSGLSKLTKQELEFSDVKNLTERSRLTKNKFYEKHAQAEVELIKPITGLNIRKIEF